MTAIVSFLLAHGYSHNAAAGIAGNIYQESKGNPESVGMGGGGLIGWTPLPAGFVTGNASADLQTQLAALLDLQPGLVAVPPRAERGRLARPSPRTSTSPTSSGQASRPPPPARRPPPTWPAPAVSERCPPNAPCPPSESFPPA